MKPTEQEIESQAREYVSDLIESDEDRNTESAEIDFYNGYCKAISQMQPEWEWQVIDFYNQETFPLEDDPVLCFTEDGLQLLQLTKYGQTVVSWEWTTCFSKPVNKSFPIDFVKQWKNVEPPKDINQ